jgi:hypothetical protein
MWRVHRRLSLRGEWIIALRPDFHYRNIAGYLLIPVSGFPKKHAEYSNRNPARLATFSFNNVESMFPRIMGPPGEEYARRKPHSSTRCGAAKVDPRPGKRRASRRHCTSTPAPVPEV